MHFRIYYASRQESRLKCGHSVGRMSNHTKSLFEDFLYLHLFVLLIIISSDIPKIPHSNNSTNILE